MQIQTVMVARCSALEIEQAVRRSLEQSSGAMGVPIMLTAKEHDGAEVTLEVSFCRGTDPVIRGCTTRRELVFINLGPEAYRRMKYPSIIVSTPIESPTLDPCTTR